MINRKTKYALLQQNGEKLLLRQLVVLSKKESPGSDGRLFITYSLNPSLANNSPLKPYVEGGPHLPHYLAATEPRKHQAPRLTNLP